VDNFTSNGNNNPEEAAWDVDGDTSTITKIRMTKE